ncbi:hypothetical protein Y1Q_0002090 [Alligator mississippiensis]|uniref:Uncharacterized protein n=1 Tax=Alligator mississippiensis TaxID=8496 RepID=A0A151MIW9_ALLMI|nr:hypothetical protein Y1Q_0002090 [Alligator mississippiensis]
MADLKHHEIVDASLISGHVAIIGIICRIREVGQCSVVDGPAAVGAVEHRLGQGQGGEDRVKGHQSQAAISMGLEHS